MKNDSKKQTDVEQAYYDIKAETLDKIIEKQDELKKITHSLIMSICAHPDYVMGEKGDEWHDLTEIADEILSELAALKATNDTTGVCHGEGVIPIKEQKDEQESAEEILDFQQYVTNLLYAAYDFVGDVTSTEFDKWVEEQINHLQEYHRESMREELIKFGTKERTRAKSIAYEFYDKLNTEVNSLISIGGDTNKMLADRRKSKADIARQIGNAISGSNALSGEESIKDRITKEINDYLNSK